MSALLLLTNSPLRCRCGGTARVTPYCLDTDSWCECQECAASAVGSSPAEAEFQFSIHYGDANLKTVAEQAVDVACRDGCAGNVVCCWVERAEKEFSLRGCLRNQRRLGCILVDTSTDDDWLAERAGQYRSYILFRPAWWREAWSIARRLRHSHEGCAAMIVTAEIDLGIYIALSPRHSVCVDGQEVRP